MKQFMTVLHGTKGDWEKHNESQQSEIMTRYFAWADLLKKEKRLAYSTSLSENCKTMKAVGGKIHTDGPYTETKEILTGVFVLLADTLDEATEISKGCPALTHGDWLQVYEMAIPLEAK